MSKSTAKKTVARKPTTRRASTPRPVAPSSSDESAAKTAGRRSRLPKSGTVVDFDASDPLTGEKLLGKGIVVESYAQGDGEDRIERVLISRLSPDLNLSADDVKVADTSA